LHQNIDHVSVWVNGTPEIVVPAWNGDKNFVDVPRIPQASLSIFELAHIVWPKLLTSLTDRFIGDRDPTFGEKFFHLKKTESESMVQPDGVTDDFRGKTVTLIAEPLSEAALSHCLRRGSTPALRGWGFNPTPGQGETAPLDPQLNGSPPKGRGLLI